MLKFRNSRTQHGEPRLTIVVEGSSDIARLAWGMQRMQCEFADVGFKVEKSLKRRMGKERWKAFDQYWRGDGRIRS